MKYQIIKKNNSDLFCPRMLTKYGSVWFDEPYGYRNFEEAKEAIVKKRQEHLKEKENITETIIFELE